MNGSAREESSAPAPQKPWIVDRLCGPSIQRLLTRNSMCASSGSALRASRVPYTCAVSTPLRMGAAVVVVMTGS